jgi:hypothetical protein
VVFADFLIGLEGWTAVVFADFLIGSAATDPQTSSSKAQAMAFCIVTKWCEELGIERLKRLSRT